MKEFHYETFRSVQPHILLLQETRKELQNTTSYFYENLNRNINKKGTIYNVGGGICIGISKHLNYRRIDNLFTTLEQEIEVLCV
jgi:hypothetical protein